MQLGPFYEDGLSNEAFFSIGVDISDVPVKNIAPPIHTKISYDLKCAVSNLSNSEPKREDISKLKIAELRIELGK